MPDRDVLSAVGEKSDRILRRAIENLGLCQYMMALLSLCALEVENRGTAMDGVRVGPVVMNGLRIRAKVEFGRVGNMGSRSSTPESSEFVDFLRQESEGLWLFCRKNPSFVTWLGEVVEKMDTYCRDKGKKFEELTFSAGVLDETDHVVITLEE